MIVYSPITQLIEFPADVQTKFDKRSFLSTDPEAVHGAPLSRAARYFVPGHLSVLNVLTTAAKKRRGRLLAVTYATFSPDGSELLVNMGGEQVQPSTYMNQLLLFSSPNLPRRISAISH